MSEMHLIDKPHRNGACAKKSSSYHADVVINYCLAVTHKRNVDINKNKNVFVCIHNA